MFERALAEETHSNAWFVADGALSVLCSIIRMLVRIDAADSPRVAQTSRCLLNISHAVLTHWPSAEILTVLFGVYKVYVAFASVASHSLGSMQEAESKDDLELLVRVKDTVAFIVKQDRDFLPLLQALEDVCSQMLAKINGG
jgi:hypothetical protein